jgi:hypothetical protein
MWLDAAEMDSAGNTVLIKGANRIAFSPEQLRQIDDFAMRAGKIIRTKVDALSEQTFVACTRYLKNIADTWSSPVQRDLNLAAYNKFAEARQAKEREAASRIRESNTIGALRVEAYGDAVISVSSDSLTITLVGGTWRSFRENADFEERTRKARLREEWFGPDPAPVFVLLL